jgi:predicted heme/steroid binding protein
MILRKMAQPQLESSLYGMGEMMRKALIILIVLFGIFLAIGCAGNEPITPNGTGTPEQAVTPAEAITEAIKEIPITETTPVAETTPAEVVTPTGENVIEGQTATEVRNVTDIQEMKEYTLKELAEYNGKNGKVYVAYQGKVYNVSNSSYLWKDGSHEGCNAGRDITEEMNKTPHGSEILKGYPVVGTLKK